MKYRKQPVTLRVKAKDIGLDPLGEALVESEKMKPYVKVYTDLLHGKQLEESLGHLRNIPVEDRYITRVMQNLDLALADLDTANIGLDLRTLPAVQPREILAKAQIRLLQLSLVVDYLEKNVTDASEPSQHDN